MNRITPQQRETIVREAVAKRDALLTGAPMAKMPDTIDFDVRVQGVPAGYKLVPIEPPPELAPLLTAYGLEERHGWSERDRAEIVARLRTRWAAILAALPDSLPPVSLAVTPQRETAMADLTDTDLLEFQAMRRVELTPEFEGPWDAKVYNESEKPEAIFSGNTPREALAKAAAACGVEGKSNG